MNKVVLLSLALSATMLLFLVIYLTPFFSKKKIRQGKFDLLQFINLFFTPLLMLPLFYFFREILLKNPQNAYLAMPRYFTEISFMFMLYLLVLGHGIHSVSVVLSKNMKDLQKHKVWQANEFFHHRFSHMLITVSAVLMITSYVVMEINHMDPVPMTGAETILIILAGIVMGIILGLASIEGSIPKEMFALICALALFIAFAFVRFGLDYRHFPFSVYVETMYISAIIMMMLYRYKRKGYPEIVPQYFFED